MRELPAYFVPEPLGSIVDHKLPGGQDSKLVEEVFCEPDRVGRVQNGIKPPWKSIPELQKKVCHAFDKGIEYPLFAADKIFHTRFVEVSEFRHLPQKPARFDTADRKIRKMKIRRAVFLFQVFRDAETDPRARDNVKFRVWNVSPLFETAGFLPKEDVCF